jgi:ribokinase
MSPGGIRLNVFVLGYSAFDVTVRVGRWPAPDTKTEVPPILVGGGGPAATAAVALARLGAVVRLMTPLTDDEPGRLQQRELLAAGVDLDSCPRPEGAASPKAVIMVDEVSGLRTIFWSRGDLPLMDPSLVTGAMLDGADFVYTDGHDVPAAIAAASLARERGLPVVLDAGSVREGSLRLAGLCTDVISSREFAPALAGIRDPASALRWLRRLGPERVAMTWGEQGALGLEGDRLFAVPAFRVPVRDTTGAGDAFHAGYAFALGEGRDFLASLQFGAAVAALKCRGWGGRRALPRRTEVEDLVATGARLPLGSDLAAALDAGSP